MEHRKQDAVFLTQRIKAALHTNKQQVYAKKKSIALPSPPPSKPAAHTHTHSLSQSHTHTHTSLSLYKQTAAEVTPSTLHIVPFIKHTKAVFAVLKYTWTVLLVKLQVNEDLSLFFPHHGQSEQWEEKKKPRIVERKAEQSCSHPPHPHSKVPLLLQAALLHSRTPAKARARSPSHREERFLAEEDARFCPVTQVHSPNGGYA